MITLMKGGPYKLIETKAHTKILSLDKKQYAWVEPPSIGEILVVSHATHKTDCVLSMGTYLVYDVKEEPGTADHIHMELEVGKGQWQGYLLLTGLPDDRKNKARIIPTHELITGNKPISTRSK